MAKSCSDMDLGQFFQKLADDAFPVHHLICKRLLWPPVDLSYICNAGRLMGDLLGREEGSVMATPRTPMFVSSVGTCLRDDISHMSKHFPQNGAVTFAALSSDSLHNVVTSVLSANVVAPPVVRNVVDEEFVLVEIGPAPNSPRQVVSGDDGLYEGVHLDVRWTLVARHCRFFSWKQRENFLWRSELEFVRKTDFSEILGRAAEGGYLSHTCRRRPCRG